ncbi:MAG TPA: S53 family peptidase, partial [Enhygromyxa sp.]|nr:S53 family peptidase [Enhygromyxa sp.]
MTIDGTTFTRLDGSDIPSLVLYTAGDPIPGDQQLSVMLVLQPAGITASDQLTQATALGSQPPKARRYSTRAELLARYAPDTTAVVSTAASFGLDASPGPNPFFMELRGTVTQLNSFFQITLTSYSRPSESGSGLRAYPGLLSAPSSIAAQIQAVLGLSDRPQPPARTAPFDVNTVDAPSQPGNTPGSVAALYSFPAGAGKGQTIGFLEDTLDICRSQLKKIFERVIGHDLPPLHTVPATREADDDCEGQLNGEAMMDIVIAGGIAYQAELVLYGLAGLSANGWYANFILALAAAVFDTSYQPSVLSMSIGAPEWSWSARERAVLSWLFAVGTLVGMTSCAATGDAGAFGDGEDPSKHLQAKIGLPSADPFVLGCGGTELLFENEKFTGEQAWDNLGGQHKPGGTGGGISSVTPIPDYQKSLTLPKSVNKGKYAGHFLGVPDVASNASAASGYQIGLEGSGNGHGTSAAAPLWAALVAILNERLEAPVGYLNPAIYAFQVAGKGTCTAIETGSNGPSRWRSYWPSAGNIWNASCGLGSPVGTALLEALR